MNNKLVKSLNKALKDPKVKKKSEGKPIGFFKGYDVDGNAIIQFNLNSPLFEAAIEDMVNEQQG